MRYRSIAYLVAVMVVSATPRGVYALYWPDSCGFEVGEDSFGESSVSIPEVAGFGLVMQQSGSGVINGWDEGYSRFTFTDCTSGRQIDLYEHIDGSGPDWATEIDYGKMVRATIEEFRLSKVLTIDEVMQQSIENKIYFRTNTLVVESCGCQKLFPEMRGNKVKYEGAK